MPRITGIGFILVLAFSWLILNRCEGGDPAFHFNPPLSLITASQTASLVVSDDQSGLRRVWVGLLKDGKETVLLDKVYETAGFLRGGRLNNDQIDLLIEPRKQEISDGEGMLRIVVRDFSWRRWGKGNKAYVEMAVTIDTVPPEIEILSNVHNISQGGAGLVIYRLSEPGTSSGVIVGDNFFPGHTGYFNDKTIAMAFIALNYQQGSGTQIYVRAWDLAGNSARAGFPHYIRNRTFKKEILEITDRFLNWKMPEFSVEVPVDTEAPLLAKFLKINRDLRQSSFNRFVAIGETTDKTVYWTGAFLRLPRSSRQAGFADHRDYRYKGSTIDRQIHQGIDLASVSHSPVPAANRGRVAFTGAIGIYGKTVVLDHGVGLFSIYSHLSSIKAENGQIVSKGDTVGLTGSTGLAGGDHLHFGMFIHNAFVNPVEWWDGSWIKNNIQTKIDTIRSISDLGNAYE